MELVQATEKDLAELLAFYQLAADDMEKKGLRHWHWGLYPNERIIRGDVEKGDLYYLRDGEKLAAAVVFMAGQEQAYDRLDWSCGIRPGIFHRLAVLPSLQGTGLGGQVLDAVFRMLRSAGCDCVRCDTPEGNPQAVRLYEKTGFRRCGTVRWPDASVSNITFDRPLREDAPLWPVRMKPAFRHGDQTPWGGCRLQEKYGKDTADERTGESLEVSCIPGLESTDAMGRKLPDLIAEYGEKLAGSYADRPFPLLLKLLDARQRLSVQVHPDDAYAAARENGRLGKTEAWLILDTPPGGGELIYGIRPGTTRQALREAALQGRAVERYLNRVRVNPGDICYIPAGCVHAIGEGIILYEIQQSSDLTYRFYDWDRTDAEGRKRELHLDKALDVTDLGCAPVPRRTGKAPGVTRVLSEPYFTLDLIRTDSMEKLPAVREFGLLTVTEGEPELCFSGMSMKMKTGETVFLPADVPAPALAGSGAAALAMPG